MSFVAFLGAIETGLLYGFLSLGVYLSFRVLKFPDLTVDGSFPLGAAVVATLITQGVNPWLATAISMVAGALAGLCTAILSVRFNILNLLASILTMIALYSINLRIMGRPNVPLLNQPTLFDGLETVAPIWVILLVGLGLTKLAMDFFLTSELGLAMRATGMNPVMASAQGIYTDRLILLGMALSNALAALSGALFAQVNGFADVALGVGTVVIGLATVILGEAIFPSRTVRWATLAVIAGCLLYRLVIAMALNADFLGLQAQDLNLVTAVIVVLALVVPQASVLTKFKRQ
ncbi:ABC transporter permease [Leptolyngbya cf. ectocarpi LEGE 11479]|uniref:ABC transporter permease n=1 Tax=Leptolyngbya cf. ectocarpi LEGE 11479 TaxID=1828722 RepID=A0A928X2Q1_LEPEC|nr:ABC transporter permease [Leptolyngbya ectocarpi]MBE9065453.1 ABC transporter permease [Leptolyngbya cf. ectocarpi LEGE 11479]